MVGLKIWISCIQIKEKRENKKKTKKGLSVPTQDIRRLYTPFKNRGAIKIIRTLPRKIPLGHWTASTRVVPMVWL